MSWSAAVLSTVSSDTEPSVIVTFDSAKYVFNTGEGTTRTWLQGRHHWKKTKGIFVTSVGTQRCSGLLGLLMSFADAGFPSTNVVGPQGLTHYLASARSYLFRNTMAVTVTEVTRPTDLEAHPKPVFRDENLTVYGLRLSANPITSTRERHYNYADPVLDPVTGKRNRSPSPDSESKRPKLAPRVPVRTLMRRNSFCATTLSGEAAHEWRKVVVEAMFPAFEQPSAGPRQSKGRKDQEGKGMQHTDAPPPEHSGSTEPLEQSAKFGYAPGLPHRDQRLPSFKPQDACDVVGYICVGPRTRGRFHPQKAAELQVPKGPLLGRLTKGETVTFTVDDGKGGQVQRTVKPEECMDPPELPKVVIILDVPSSAYISSAIASFDQSPFYRQFLSKNCDNYVLHAVFHLCGQEVLEDASYKEFMGRFGDSVHHLVSSREHSANPATYTRASLAQLKLNQLDENMFPLPRVDLIPRKNLSDVSGLPGSTTSMARNLVVSVRPPHAPALEQAAVDDDEFHSIVSGTAQLDLEPAVADAFAAAKASLVPVQDSAQPPLPGDDVVIIPLGTSSAAPTTYRNVSSTLIQIPKYGNILLDSGEGTWGQLARLFGDDGSSHTTGVWQTLRDLKCIFISHIHGDHHIGLAKILAMRKKLSPPPTEPLYVVGVRSLLLYLRELSDIEDLGIDSKDGNDVVTILADALNWRSPNPYGPRSVDDPWMDLARSRSDAVKMREALGLQQFIAVDVLHRTRSYGVVIEHRGGWSLVFSGDTMPTENLVNVGTNATLLIHEATMGDDQEDLAEAKAHSTFGQAIDIGSRMNAENVLLTHFSARFPKMPPASYVQYAEGPTVAMAFDHARIRIGDMKKLRHYLPAIERSFGDVQELFAEGEEIA